MSTKKPATRTAFRWDALPHDKLCQRALASMTGARERSKEDSQKHVLTRRLPELDPGHHFRYVEIKCAWMVELLRGIRDMYRDYLEERGCRPLADMYWVVFRFAVIPNAVKVLQAAMLDYIVQSKINRVSFQRLFGMWLVPILPALPALASKETPWEIEARGIVASLTQEEDIMGFTRGLFSREGQRVIGSTKPWPTVLLGQMTFLEHLEKRQALWDSCYPWTECLSRLFDAAQGEVLFQGQGLGQDGHRAELTLTELSPFQEISYNHLQNMRSDTPSGKFRDELWIALLRELDQKRVPLDELDGKARKVRINLLKKGLSIGSWEECYNDKASAWLEDGERQSMKRAVTHSIQNAAKAAAHQKGKVWNMKATSPGDSKARVQNGRATLRPRLRAAKRAPVARRPSKRS